MAKATDKPSAADLQKARKLVTALIAEGQNPPTLGGSNMWDPWALAAWYGNCRALSALLGKGNVWETLLCSWDSDKADDRAFHTAMLGTLRAIEQNL
jgi:hypothetical protein